MNSEVSTSSLNDIMFFLMLFFLIMSTMVAPSIIKVNVPKSDAGKAVSKKNIVLAIDSNSNYYLNNEKVAFADIDAKLKGFTNADSTQQPTVVLNASRSLQFQTVVDVMSVVYKNKFKMAFGTSNK
ncbi:MAG TPA: biopolymer transporter ExbD [Chitinophagales bacterium]|nr:biopolymer transporter ExbD [Chitinophagales bacterium]